MNKDCETLAWSLPSNFPLADLRLVGELLKDANFLLAGHVEPKAGLYEPAVYFYNQDRGIKTVILPDRNVTSRMARVVQGDRTIDNLQLRLCAGLLGFAHALDIEFEPSIAYHELAHRCGNTNASDELGWFRAANDAAPQDMLNVALGRSVHVLRQYVPHEVQIADLAKPIKRWNRNYIVALKVLELDLGRGSALDKALRLLDWMASDLVFAGPAMMLAVTYLGTHSPARKKVFKGKGAKDRSEAIAGVKNAAWDITHLSDFVRRVNLAITENKTYYIFATFDNHLMLVAQLLKRIGTENTDLSIVEEGLCQWWAPHDAKVIAKTMSEQVARINSDEHVPKTSDDPNFIQKMMEAGERAVITAV